MIVTLATKQVQPVTLTLLINACSIVLPLQKTYPCSSYRAYNRQNNVIFNNIILLNDFNQMFSNHEYGFIVLESSSPKMHFTFKKSLCLVSIFDFCSFTVFIVLLFSPVNL